MTEPIRLLHLSDIHFRTGTTWDSDPVLRALVRFIGEEVHQGLVPDLIAITGDLAFSGKPEEYALAREWLDGELWSVLSQDLAAPLPRDRLLLVPGNHDVDREAVDSMVVTAQDRLLNGKDQQRIAKTLADKTQRKALLWCHAAYLKFYEDWLGTKASPLPWWQRTFDLRGQALHVAGLDSAWMARGNEDRGRLLLSRYQINQTALTKEAEGAQWRLALLHHPWDYLAELEAQEARQQLHLHRDLVLRGHLHEGETAMVRSPDPSRSCLELAAGCVYENSRYPNAFQWIELYPDPRRVRIHFRCWNKGAWQVDRNQPGSPDGKAEIVVDESEAFPPAATTAEKKKDGPMIDRRRKDDPEKQTVVKDLTAEGDVVTGSNTQVRKDVAKNNKMLIGIFVGAFTAVAAVVGIMVGNKNQSVVIHGDVHDSNVANELTIYQGDPPEVRQQKVDQAKRLIAEEVLTNIANMDARLGYAETILREDSDFDERLGDVRDRVAPIATDIFESSYDTLIMKQQVSSLRNAFSSRPLYEVREPLVHTLIEGNADAERVKAFYNGLSEVRDVAESLLQELSTASTQTSAEQKTRDHFKKRVDLAARRMVNRSKTAYFYGLMVLKGLEIPLPNVEDRLVSLQHLEPRQLVDEGEAARLLQANVKEAEDRVNERAILLKEADGLRDKALNEYAKINEKLKIQDSDSWNVVVGKAISLRQLGRTTESVAAFSRYADMFGGKDQTAKQYSRTAAQFTLQLHSLGLLGGVYLYEIVEAGIAEKAGLKPGDIIIEYAGRTIANMNDITEALRDKTAGDPIRLTYVRMSEAGAFQRQTVMVPSGPLGAGMMPI